MGKSLETHFDLILKTKLLYLFRTKEKNLNDFVKLNNKKKYNIRSVKMEVSLNNY